MAKSFSEKTSSDGIINGGFFVLSPKVFDYLPKDRDVMFEEEPLKELAKDGELAVYLGITVSGRRSIRIKTCWKSTRCGTGDNMYGRYGDQV